MGTAYIIPIEKHKLYLAILYDNQTVGWINVTDTTDKAELLRYLDPRPDLSVTEILAFCQAHEIPCGTIETVSAIIS